MNNQQFRRLVLDTPRRQAQQDGASSSTPKAGKPSATPALGSRMTASIPMTPRQVQRNFVNEEFRRQLAEKNTTSKPEKRQKSVLPKGTKLAAGYTDRTKTRLTDDEGDELSQRIQALEESMKLGQIDKETFDNIVSEITGGDITTTHLIKGLDRNLLNKVRRGEDVLRGKPKEEEKEQEASPQPEIDSEEELEMLEAQGINSISREKVQKKGEMAPPPPPVSGAKRKRDALLAELKAQRQAVADAAAAEREMHYPTLGEGFRKVGPRAETHRIEVDKNGREVLIITDADGKQKRKVRKQKAEDPKLEAKVQVLDDGKGINMPGVAPPAPEEDSDEDIFQGVGDSYNPLGDVPSGSESSDDEEGKNKSNQSSKKARAASDNEDGEIVQSTTPREMEDSSAEEDGDDNMKPADSLPRRNWFVSDSETTSKDDAAAAADATVRAALQKVRTMDPDSALLQTDEQARLKKRAAQLAAADRDMEDLDMGFGGSRFDDADDMEREGDKVKFSEWKGIGAEDDEVDADKDRGGKKRKRGPKKKKGDKNSASDVLQAMERHKTKGTLG